MKQIIRIVLLVLLALVLLLAAALGIFSYRNLHWYDKNQRSIKRAGAIERQVTLPSGSVINYGEVPSDKPALLLIHGQMGAWEDYADLLPELLTKVSRLLDQRKATKAEKKAAKADTETTEGEA